MEGGGGPGGIHLPSLGPAGESCGAVRASRVAKKSQNKNLGVFFQAAFDFDAPRPQNTTQKSKNIEKLDFIKSRFLKIDEKWI